MSTNSWLISLKFFIFVMPKEKSLINKKKRPKENAFKVHSKETTSISKRDVSVNWLSFIGSKKLSEKCGSMIEIDTETEKKRLLKNDAKKTPEVTKVLSIDCEMVSDLNNKSILARVSVVNYNLACIYDKYVKPPTQIGDLRTRFSGVREEDLMNGTDFEIVRNEVKSLLRNKILVGHGLGNDFKVLKFGHYKQLIRDTSKYKPFEEVNDSKTPSLKKLAKMFLNETIQEGEHNSIEDAKTAMKLYKKYRREWEISLLNSKSNKIKGTISPSIEQCSSNIYDL